VNDTEYNQYIEYWVSENRNYHKPKGTIFIPNAQWARMFTKAWMKLQENFNSIKNV
jgi:formylmethanofuran dehydrogenase subunit D